MSERAKLALVALVGLAGLLLAYANHFDNGFYFDDAHTIVSNTYIRDLGNLPSFFTDATTFSSLPANRAYRPMVTTLNAFNYWLGGGLEPRVFHASMFTAYVGLLVLLFVFTRRLFDAARPHPWNAWLALGTTGFYAFHTANAETLNYVISRSDSFSTLCVMAALVLYQSPRARRVYLYLGPLVVGLYTKQTALMFAPLAFLHSVLFEADAEAKSKAAGLLSLTRARRALWSSLPAFVVGGGLFLLNQAVLTPDATVSSNAASSRLQFFWTQLFVSAHYLGNFILPLRLSADPDFTLIPHPTDGRVLLGALVTGLLVVLALLAARRRRTAPLGFGILWFYVALAPTSSVVPLFQIANDHRTFFPYIGLAVALGWGVALLVERWKARMLADRRLRWGAAGLFAAVLAAHAYGVRERNEVWGSTESLWYDVTLKSPGNARGLMNYGLSQMAKGRYDVARDYFERGLELWPHYSYLHVNLAILKNATGQSAEAEESFRTGLAYGRENPETYYYYARWLRDQERFDEASALLEEGRRLSPGHERIRRLSETLRHAGTVEAPTGVEALRRAVQAAPSARGYIDLSLAYYRAGRYTDTIEACREALTLDPASAVAYNNICSAYAKLQQWDRAVAACQRALELDPGFELARANLRWAQDGRRGS